MHELKTYKQDSILFEGMLVEVIIRSALSIYISCDKYTEKESPERYHLITEYVERM